MVNWTKTEWDFISQMHIAKVLKFVRVPLKGHHPSYLLSDKDMAGGSLEILCAEYWPPEVLSPCQSHIVVTHSWTDIPGQPGVGLTPTKARIMQASGRWVQYHMLNTPERAFCDPEPLFQIGVVTVSPAVSNRIINIINNKGFNYGCFMQSFYNYHPKLIWTEEKLS